MNIGGRLATVAFVWTFAVVLGALPGFSLGFLLLVVWTVLYLLGY